MPRGRSPLPPGERKPRTSGKSRPPTMEEAWAQRGILLPLAEALGRELYRVGATGSGPASWAAVARAAGLSDAATVRRATLWPDQPGARYVRLTTLQGWERSVRTWMGEDPKQRTDILHPKRPPSGQHLLVVDEPSLTPAELVAGPQPLALARHPQRMGRRRP